MLAGLAACMLQTPAAAQPKPVFLRSTCVKANPGAGPEFEKLHADTIHKLAQYRIKQGAMLRYALSRAVLPSGEQAECDYMVSFSYSGFPAEITPESTAKNMKAAGVAMAFDAYAAKNRSLARPIATRLFLLRAEAGAISAGNYIHINRKKINNQQQWLKLETEIWKPLQEARVAGGQLSGWAS